MLYYGCRLIQYFRNGTDYILPNTSFTDISDPRASGFTLLYFIILYEISSHELFR